MPPASNSALTIEPILPVPSSKLQRWARERLGKPDNSMRYEEKYSSQSSQEQTVARSRPGNSSEEPLDMRYDAYMCLLDHRIRNAWVHLFSFSLHRNSLTPFSQLYTLYLIPANFDAVAKPLYIHPTSSNILVHLSLSHSLHGAAEAELLKNSAVIDVAALYRECDSAFSALSELLEDDRYFFSAEAPGLFDASVFAYTQLLLDEGIGWQERRMVNLLKGYKNLIKHRRRILQDYFPGKSC